LLPRDKVKSFPPWRRTVAERLLLVLQGAPDIVADEVEQLADFDMRLLDVAGNRDRTGYRG
jgi:hypothetical protein